MSSRGQLAAMQRNGSYRARGVVAPHVALATFYDETISQPVRGCVAETNFRKGDIAVRLGEKFYLVNYKLPHFFYVVVNQGGIWECSSSDDRVRAACIALVQLHIQKKANLLLNGQY